MRLSRCWPALIYVVAGVLVQCCHDHHGASERAARCEAGCADDRTHLSGHPAPDLSHAPADCLACKYRHEHQSWLLSPPTFLRPGVGVLLSESSLQASPRPLRRASCRAPPRA